MPLTPFHALAVLSPYFKAKRLIDPFALAASASFIDLEPVYLFLRGDVVDHAFLHGFALALTIYPLLVALVVFSIERVAEGKLRSAYAFLKLKPVKVKYSPLSVYLCCLFGGFNHVFFDMFTHESMPYVVYPLVFGNPFYLGQWSGIVEVTVVALAAYSVFLWFRVRRQDG